MQLCNVRQKVSLFHRQFGDDAVEMLGEIVDACEREMAAAFQDVKAVPLAPQPELDAD